MRKIGKTVIFDKPPKIIGHAGVAGKKEGEGPLAKDFDMIFEDTTMGQQSYELAESAMLHDAIIRSLSNAGVAPSSVDFVLSGDLLNQCMGSAFALKDLEIPSIGLFGACSTMALSLSTGAMLVNGGASCVVCATSSHFCSSERQFRFPLEYGGQRPPTAQWTVTGAGSSVVSNEGRGTEIKAVQIGTITDLGITDANNMGAAMAPAAADTICQNLKDFGRRPEDYDHIITGDLGSVGREILIDLLKKEGYDISEMHLDCGMLIYESKAQGTGAGGSGCGCSAVTLAGHFLKQVEQGKLQRILFVPTGALLSTVSFNEGKTVPGIAHGVVIEHAD